MNFERNIGDIKRMAEESLDASFNALNLSSNSFTKEKIFDVFDQTFPTAFVLSTGYWIFFVGSFGAPLCVCGRFGLVCRHVRSKYHWVDLQPIVGGYSENFNGENILFLPRIYGAVLVKDCKVKVELADGNVGVEINMDLHYAKMSNRTVHINFKACYGFVSQFYSAPYSVTFSPNPMFLYGKYGKYLKRLREYRAHFSSMNFPEDLIITSSIMPSSSLFLLSVNVNRFAAPTAITAMLLENITQKSGNLESRNFYLEVESIWETRYEYSSSKSDYFTNRQYDLDFPRLPRIKENPDKNSNVKRKRGRPMKNPRSTTKKSYSLVTKSKMKIGTEMMCEYSDPNFVTLNNIFKESNKKVEQFDRNDIDLELDLIDQLIRDEEIKRNN